MAASVAAFAFTPAQISTQSLTGVTALSASPSAFFLLSAKQVQQLYIIKQNTFTAADIGLSQTRLFL
jgi:hypothetical protein